MIVEHLIINIIILICKIFDLEYISKAISILNTFSQIKIYPLSLNLKPTAIKIQDKIDFLL